MRPEPRSVVSGSAADPILNKLVEELVDKLQAGKTVDREAYRIRYPEQAEKLDKLLPAIEIMAALGLSINSPAPAGGVSDSDSTGDKTGPHRVLGDFRLLREIGRGGMAIVYEAEQISLRRRLALKVLPHTPARDPRQRDRFQVEARAAALLQHPHIVPVHAVGFEGDEPYYAMQLIHGPTLAAVIRALRRRHAKASEESEEEAHGETALVDVQVVSGIVDDLVSGRVCALGTDDRSADKLAAERITSSLSLRERAGVRAPEEPDQARRGETAPAEPHRVSAESSTRSHPETAGVRNTSSLSLRERAGVRAPAQPSASARSEFANTAPGRPAQESRDPIEPDLSPTSVRKGQSDSAQLFSAAPDKLLGAGLLTPTPARLLGACLPTPPSARPQVSSPPTGHSQFDNSLADEGNPAGEVQPPEPPQATSGSLPEESARVDPKQRIASRFPRTIHPFFAGRSQGFYRAAAGLAIQAAEALDHAHQNGVIHRDVKPANLLLDRTGCLWVADFGLARMQEDSDLTKTGDLLGTLRYMSPEQAMGKRVVIDHRTDIYSLGVTLYELLTLTPAIPGQDRQEVLHGIASQDPRAPRKLDPAIPKDLETIVIKAMAKEPATRYQTAAALAEDLQRFVAGLPIKARPLGMSEHLWRWTLRNKTKAAMIVVGVLVLFAGVAGGFQYDRLRLHAAEAESKLMLADRNAARARLDVVSAERDSAQRTEQELRLRNLILSIEQVRSSAPQSGWRNEVLKIGNQAAVIRPDPEIRDQVIAGMRGFDARQVTLRREFGGSDLVFNRQGQLLLMGGLNPGQGKDRRGKLWDLDHGDVQYSEQTGFGSAAFRDDGTPLQLAFEPPASLLLWDVARNHAIGRYTLPVPETPVRIALSDDGSGLAAAVSKGVIVWDAATARVLREFSGTVSALSFSPDNQLLATGDDTGRIVVRSLSTGSTIATVRLRPARILRMKFARDYRRDAQGASGWLLAASGTAGSLVVWDLDRQQPRAILGGVQFDTHGLAFNADHNILVSAGRSHLRLWDLARGESLLSLRSLGQHSGLALSLDGKRLATSGVRRFMPEHVALYELEDGRGFQSLRGLHETASGVEVSQSGRLMAGLTHDFQVGVWDLPSRRLRYVREAPEGFHSLSVEIALSPDERFLALCGGSEAQLWDLATGRTLQRWPLPSGAFDIMEFDPSGHSLMVARVERRSGTKDPYLNEDLSDPNVVNLRDLLGPVPRKPIREVAVFTEGHGAVFVPGFRTFVLHGVSHRAEGDEHFIRAYDGATGNVQWSIPLPLAELNREPVLRLDPSGSLLGLAFSEKEPKTLLYSMSTGEFVGTLKGAATALGLKPHQPGGYYTTEAQGRDRGFALLRTGTGVLVNLEIDNPQSSGPGFHPDGRRLYWPSGDGTIAVCDLERLEESLRAQGWGK